MSRPKKSQRPQVAEAPRHEPPPAEPARPEIAPPKRHPMFLLGISILLVIWIGFLLQLALSR